MMISIPQRLNARRQQGVALFVALVLLVIITMLGLAAIGGTMMQSQMAANQYDRATAFQSATSAIWVGVNQLLQDPSNYLRDCQSGAVVCQGNPFNDANVSAGDITTVSSGDYDAPVVSSAQPQYVVEYMGNWVDPLAGTGFGHSANAGGYGGTGLQLTTAYYRITARNGSPDGLEGRAKVTVQAMVKQVK